jgi:hypothetical protein
MGIWQCTNSINLKEKVYLILHLSRVVYFTPLNYEIVYFTPWTFQNRSNYPQAVSDGGFATVSAIFATVTHCFVFSFFIYFR